MIINSAAVIYFSPTGTTKKILNSILSGLEVYNPRFINITMPSVRDAELAEITEDIVLIGVPVYEERIPKILNDYFEKLKYSRKPVVLVAVYGNIGDGITLNELHTMASNKGLVPVAAASFIGEHSFSTDKVPLAEGRPDGEDLKKAEAFGRSILEKLKPMDLLQSVSVVIPQGKLPLLAKILPENSARLFTKTPVVDSNKCNKCGLCVKLCPMRAVDEKSLEIKETECLRCFCCVKKCARNARQIVYKKKMLVSKMLASKNKQRKEPKLYL